jgi:hypothetical protein
VNECKRNIIEIYSLNHLAQEDIAAEVQKLLDKDRFICRADSREVPAPLLRQIPPCIWSPKYEPTLELDMQTNVQGY